MLGFEATLNPFRGCEHYREIADLPFDERIAALRTGERRRAILDDAAEGRVHPQAAFLLHFDKIFILGDPPDYEQDAAQSVAARAARAGVSAAEFAYEQMLAGGGRTLLYLPFLNYADGSLEPSLEMMRHPFTVLGLGDGGAHLGTICDASFSTHMLTHWTRDRRRGAKIPVETAIKWQAHDTARAVGLHDRGILRAGYKADINVIDYARLRLREPVIVRDLPAGGGRLMQKAEGYRYAIVSGEITYRDGVATAALPGRLVRGAQPAPGVAGQPAPQEK
jgi:N-acyl-D-aspartate/D-glutamate deacylase